MPRATSALASSTSLNFWVICITFSANLTTKQTITVIKSGAAGLLFSYPYILLQLMAAAFKKQNKKNTHTHTHTHTESKRPFAPWIWKNRKLQFANHLENKHQSNYQDIEVYWLHWSKFHLIVWGKGVTFLTSFSLQVFF